MADAALIVDRRQDASLSAGLHAIFIGVSDYTNLTHPEDEPPGAGMAALQKLRSSALSVFRMMERLRTLEAQERLLKPIITVRMLMSPTQEELDADAALADFVAQNPPVSPDFATIKKQLQAWRKDVAKGRDQASLFFFSGHGVRLIGNNAILLSGDFDPAGDVILDTAFDFHNVFSAMAPTAKYPDIGRTQYYFVDACRNKPEELQTLEDPEPSRIFDVRESEFDDRQAPIAFATRNGGTAAGLAGDSTEFTQALLWAVEQGSTDCQTLPGRSDSGWVMTFDSMKFGLNRANPNLAKRVEFTGLDLQTIFSFRPDPPPLSIALSFVPAEVDARIKSVELIHGDTETPYAAARDSAGTEWKANITSGIYRLSVTPADGSFAPYRSKLETLTLRFGMPWTITLGAGQ